MRCRELSICAWMGACTLTLVAAPAAAWNSPGHMIVALVAYGEMNDEAKARAAELLHAHPRFADHFERELAWNLRRADRAAQDEWYFAYAATWPDAVRSASDSVTPQDVRDYNRPWWHFVNEPIYLSDAEEAKLAPTVRFNRRRDPPDAADDPDMNVIQAIKNSARIVGDDGAAAELRAVHLCWLLHLTGDAHQPLHSSTLVTSHRFTDGDRGGNNVNYCHDFPLHAFWDAQISTDESYATIRILADDLARNEELAAAGRQAAATLDPGAWIDESHALAKRYAYTPEIADKIAAREGHTHLGDLNPAPQYTAEAEALAERQAAIAAHRLAKLLEQLFE